MIIADEMLSVNEYFYSLQGEGVYSGQAAFFIRLAGCNVCCPWCDSPNSWDISKGETISCKELCSKAVDSGTSIVVITGGEPALQNLTLITQQLKEAGLRVHIESSGSEPQTGTFDWVTISPKRDKACRDDWFSIANELKIVISNDNDFIWAEELSKRVNEECILTLQSEWSNRGEIYPKIVEYIRKNSRWRLSIQTHKYLGIE